VLVTSRKGIVSRRSRASVSAAPGIAAPLA
jgi:hypothetical protein